MPNFRRGKKLTQDTEQGYGQSDEEHSNFAQDESCTWRPLTIVSDALIHILMIGDHAEWEQRDSGKASACKPHRPHELFPSNP